MGIFSGDRAKLWLAVYLIGSIPVLMFYAAGFAGWFFEYPMPLFISIFVVLAIPLLLILLRTPGAARWNIFMLRTTAILLIVRIVLCPHVSTETGGSPHHSD